MASIIMHLAVTQKIINTSAMIFDRDRLMLGCILPDYSYGDDQHYKRVIGDSKIFDITCFREKHRNRLKAWDPIYLGYYLHLVQDMVFRDFMYNIHRWRSRIPGNVEKLYHDYRLLNGYLTEKYCLSADIFDRACDIPDGEYSEFVLNREELKGEVKRDLGVQSEVVCEYYVFDPSMAEDFIERATAACLHELDALKGEKEHLNEKDYSWKISSGL